MSAKKISYQKEQLDMGLVTSIVQDTNDYRMIDITIEELENKKVFNAMYPFNCELCERAVDEDEEFVFMGDKKKVCCSCRDEFVTRLEEIKVGNSDMWSKDLPF